MSPLRFSLALLALAAGGLLAAPPAQANGGQTFQVTSSPMCGGAGTFEQAVKDANASPGQDTIAFTPGLTVYAGACAYISLGYPFPVRALESVDIVGNGATVTSYMAWVDENGKLNNTAKCPGTIGSLAHWVSESSGFLAVGEYGHNNTGIAVTASGLNFDNLPTLVAAYEKSTFTLTDSTAKNINNFIESCSRPAIEGFPGAAVTLTDVRITDSYAPGLVAPLSIFSGLIHGADGPLTMDHVFLANIGYGRAVAWQNYQTISATAKIVSSKFLDAGGILADATSTDIVNSTFWSQGQKPSDRILALQGATRVQASTFYWERPDCTECNPPSPGMGFQTAGTGTVEFASSAVGAWALYPNSGPLLFGDTTMFSSDNRTWVQETANQTNADLQAIMPGVNTGIPGLSPDSGPMVWWQADVTPLLGTPGQPGVLLDAVPDAAPGGTNELVSPIDGQPIVTDVFGNERWDSGNNTRNIGAIQNVGSPRLNLAGVSDGAVALGWNQPQVPDPTNHPLTGYTVFFRPQAGGPEQMVSISGATTFSGTVPGLTNGTPYVFEIAGVTDQGTGPRSNEVTATPLGDVGIPLVSATGGNTQVTVSWTEPDLKGRPGPPLYFVQYRKVGELTWANGPGTLSARITVIPGLTNGTPYEFAVTAASTDGTVSPQLGTATATPYGPIGTPKPKATPGNGQVALAWPVPDAGGHHITGYRVYYRVWGSSSWRGFGIVTSPSATVTGLSNGRKYAFGVVAVAADGAHSDMGMTSATPMATLPLTIKGARPGGDPLPRLGSTVVIGSATTSAQGTVETRVRCGLVSGASVRGDLRYCRATVGANGRVTISTFGYPGVRVTVTQRAVPRPGQTGYQASAAWTRSWTTTG